ncbi:insulinase family protein [Candidatus Aerophobetes bacterium]|nr:insulinase family protein [Candidatus Aerophobetes bacterium]
MLKFLFLYPQSKGKSFNFVSRNIFARRKHDFLFKIATSFIIFLVMFASLAVWAEQLQWQETVQEFRLENGLKVLMLKRERSPTIAFRVLFKTGAVDEPTGKTGLAHLLEHMMFKGTTTIGTEDYEKEWPLLEKMDRLAKKLLEAEREGRPEEEIENIREIFEATQKEAEQYVKTAELNKIYDESGATELNAMTWQDGTLYTVSLPSNRLELWARLSADSIANPVFREFYKERSVVMEERRQRTETEPTGFLREHFLAAAFIAHPYRSPTLGWMSDLEGMMREDLKEFYQRYYVPANAVVALVGDIEPEQDIHIIRRYFLAISPGDIPPSVSTQEPKQQGERRTVVKFDAEPEVFIGYHKPTYPDREAYVFDVIDTLLTAGRTSRLFKRMVQEERVALSVRTGSGFPAQRYNNLFYFHGIPRHPHTTRELEDIFYEELESLKRELVSEKELEKIKNQVRANFIYGLKSNEGLATRLVYYEAFFDGWEMMMKYPDIIESITAEEIMQVAREYFTEDNRTVATLARKKENEENKINKE